MEVIFISNKRDERDIFLIPPNFLNEGSLFGGMLKLRNAIEAVVLVVGITIPVLKITALSFTGKTIVLCLTALPVGIFALIGIGFSVLSLFLSNLVWSMIAGVTAFSCFWSIKELYDQERRVAKGWFPANPKRRKK